MRKIIIILMSVICIATLCSSCSGVGSYVAYFDDEISKKITDEINELDEKIIESIRRKDVDAINEQLSKALKESDVDINSLVNMSSDYIKASKTEQFKRIYVKTDKVGELQPKIVEDLSDEDGIIYSASGYSKEAIISVISAESDSSEVMIYIEYIKQKGDWEVYRFNIGELSAEGYTAPEFYAKAKKLADQDHLVAAYMYATPFSKLKDPVPFIQYANLSSMEEFFTNLREDTIKKHKFPFKLDRSDIEIYGFELLYMQQGFIPKIYYITDLDLSDNNKQAIEEEVYNIHEQLKSIFTGLNENFDLFYYRGFNEYPVDASKEYMSYGTAVENE